MATTDTDVSQLVINKLTKAQYDGITTPSDTELYFVDDGKTYATTDMLATVATSGSYTDLTNKPTIPAAQVNSDWNASSGVAEILNKPSLATVATSGSYTDLTDKPTIPTVNNATLTIQKNNTNVATFTANASSNVTANIAVPTATSDLNNDSGFLTSSTLPVATTSSLGVVQVGSGLTVSSGGVLSATGGGVADSVAWGHITGTMADQTDLSTALGNKVDSSSLAAVATSGSYNDLLNTPTIPAAQIQSDWTQADNTKLDYIKNKPSLAAVATSGAYSDLSGTPSLATVATSGSYNDLSSKPTIPAAQVNSDWDAASGVAQILNKPSLAAVATSGSYTDLVDQPTIPTVNNATLTIQKNGTTVQTFTANASSNKTANITVPTTVAELSDASNYATTSALAGKQNTLTAGDHISISSDTISAIDYVHSESPVTLSSPTPVVTGSMIASGTITASNIAAGEMVTLTLSTTDIGEGAALATNTLYGVYQ